MEILIDNRQSRYRIPLEDTRKKAHAVLNALGSPEAELSIVYVDDEEIADLNRHYLNRQGTTNVIAFPMREGAFPDITPQLLGDVVISTDTAARESEQAGMAMGTRLDELLVHGILHLFGYDHEADPEDARRMDEKHLEMMNLIRAPQG